MDALKAKESCKKQFESLIRSRYKTKNYSLNSTSFELLLPNLKEKVTFKDIFTFKDYDPFLVPGDSNKVYLTFWQFNANKCYFEMLEAYQLGRVYQVHDKNNYYNLEIQLEGNNLC
jgi:hypothetical protein